MIKILHTADIHILNTDRHEEYISQFEKLYEIVKKNDIDIVAIVGDLFDNFIEISNEAEIIAGDFLNNLSKYSKEVIIVSGNHDLRKKALNRTNSIETVVKLINNTKVTYFDKSGFYDDKLFNIVWVNHAHQEKNINPWIDIPQTIDDSKIYIDLFHDPVNGCSTDAGKTFDDKKLRNANDFKGSLALLGDIHKFQALGKNKKVVYPSSLIQQDFGETISTHGVCLWNINTKNDISFNFIDIPNDHAFINFYIDEPLDYDTLNLDTPIFKDMEIKIQWKDYSSKMTTVNEKKIRDYIKDKFNITKIKFEKIYLYNDVISSKMLSETLDLSDLQVQTNIFKEYLEEQKYKSEDIKEILKIDDIINSRLQLSDTIKNIVWSVDKFWFSNFKSYGEDNVIDWKDTDGIWQVSGINKNGKTSVLDALTYILYGKTTTTVSSMKFGDSRYINNKKFLDYCLGGAVIDVNGEKFVIQRRTERVWNKNKTALTSCPTSLDFYSSEEIIEENKLTGEVKAKTQKILDSILSEFLDFIRMSYTNADNLNNILSETRAIFIDNVIRDAGMDIFETKLNEFKEYKKELTDEKLVVDIQKSESDVSFLRNEIIDINTEIDENKFEISKLELESDKNNIDRDDLNKKLNNIDSSMLEFDENSNLNSIENYENKINESKDKNKTLEIEIEKLPINFDATNLNELKNELKNTNKKISEKKEEISKLKNSLTESDNKIDKVNLKIDELKQSEIRKISTKIINNDLQIEIIKNKKSNIVKDEIKKITSEIQEFELKVMELNSTIKLLQKDGVNAKTANEELDKEIETFKNSKSCPSCGREYDEKDPKYSEHLAHLEDKIKSLEIKKEPNILIINDCLLTYKKLKNESIDCNITINNLIDMKNKLNQGDYTEDIKTKLKEVGSSKKLNQDNIELNALIKEIENNNFDNSEILNENIEKGKKLIINLDKIKEDANESIKNIEFELQQFNIDDIENNILIEETNRDNFELRKQKISNKDNIILTIENFNFKIKELKNDIEKYKKYKVKIDENKELQILIDSIDEKIIINKDKIKKIEQEIISFEKIILLKETEINNISIRIKKYLAQKKKEELLKEYSKCIGRDGIPSFLLKKSIHLINRELSELLSNVDFTLFFDEELELKLSMDDRMDVNQPAITSSGAERTFSALALKMALRQINVKSKSSIIFLDEITGKLIGDSIQQFMDFLDVLKTKVEKIVIIEHVHQINFDALIEVKKDENLISHLELQK